MGWVLIGMAGYFLSPVIPWEIGKTVVLSSVVLAAAIHLGWVEKSRGTWRGFPVFKKGFGLLLLCGGIFFIVSPLLDKDKGIEWIPYSDEILQRAAVEGKPVILDFYADWCVPCVGLDKGIFREEEVVELSRQFVPVRVDLTKKQPYQKEIQEKFRVKGVPTIVFINRQGKEVRGLRVESYEDAKKIKERMMTLVEKEESP
jgi:thiol:disulfide interchange protein DsbD